MEVLASSSVDRSRKNLEQSLASVDRSRKHLDPLVVNDDTLNSSRRWMRGGSSRMMLTSAPPSRKSASIFINLLLVSLTVSQLMVHPMR